MNKIMSFLYGVVCYLVFFLSFLYAVGFLGNMVVPKSINSGVESDLSQSLIINLILLSLFAIQHTIMARPAFKEWWTNYVPPHLERSTFVLVASLLLLLIFWQWQPLTGIVWHVDSAIGQTIVWGIFWVGWLIVLLSTFMINHFDLFGLRQVWLHLNDQEYSHVNFQKTALYRYIRHPIMLGFIIAFWATPNMTTGHLLFAMTTTLYILIGIQFEEQDLIDTIGPDYENYRQQVSMIIPKVGLKNRNED